MVFERFSRSARARPLTFFARKLGGVTERTSWSGTRPIPTTVAQKVVVKMLKMSQLNAHCQAEDSSVSVTFNPHLFYE